MYKNTLFAFQILVKYQNLWICLVKYYFYEIGISVISLFSWFYGV
jgi:hypothetical protein